MWRWLVVLVMVPGVAIGQCSQAEEEALIEQSWQNHNNGVKDPPELNRAVRECYASRDKARQIAALSEVADSIEKNKAEAKADYYKRREIEAQEQAAKELKRLNDNIESDRMIPTCYEWGCVNN